MPLMRRHVDPVGRGEEHPAVDPDRPAPWSPQPCDRVEDRRLARAGWTEERGDAGVDPDGRRQHEGSLRDLDVERDHVPRLSTRRLAASSAMNAIATDT